MDKREFIELLILNYKKQHDGCSPTIRKLVELYANATGKILSTSVVYYHLNKLAAKRNWVLTTRGIETNGEWQNLTKEEELEL